MMLAYVTYALAGLVAALVAGNNLSAVAGTLIGSRILGEKAGALLGSVGYVLGLLVEGERLRSAVSYTLPVAGYFSALVLGISVVLFTVALFIRAPLSLTMALVASSVGVSLRVGYSVNVAFVFVVALTWVLAPLASAFTSILAYRALVARKVDQVWRTLRVYRILLVAVSLFTAYTLGANTLGLVASVAGYSPFTLSLVSACTVFGSFLLSRGVVKRVGSEMYAMSLPVALVSLVTSSTLVEAATQFSVPLSNTQTLTAGVFGLGLSKGFRMIRTFPFLVILLTWALTPVAGLLLGYALG